MKHAYVSHVDVPFMLLLEVIHLSCLSHFQAIFVYCMTLEGVGEIKGGREGGERKERRGQETGVRGKWERGGKEGVVYIHIQCMYMYKWVRRGLIGREGGSICGRGEEVRDLGRRRRREGERKR